MVKKEIPTWRNQVGQYQKNIFFLQNTKNHLSVKLDSHHNKMWNGTDDNIAPLLKVPSLSVPIVVLMSAVLKDF